MPAVVIQEWTDMTRGWTFFVIFRKKVRPNVPVLSTCAQIANNQSHNVG
jgi:hypothetical protein